MTSAWTTADAYEAWLGIPASQHPPHHYALLGLPPLAADEHAILQAYQQQAARVGAHLAGPQADAARRLLGELAAAQACLLSPEARASYDRWLKQQLQSSPTGSVAAAVVDGGFSRPAPRSKIVPPAANGADGEVASPPYLAHDDEEPGSILPWLIGGVCAGLLGVAVLGVALFGFQRARPVRPTQTASAAGQSDREDRSAHKLDGAQRSANRERDGKFVSAGGDDDVLGQRVAPLTTAPEQLRLDDGVVGPPISTSTGGEVEVVASVEVDDAPAKPGAEGAPTTPETGSPSSDPTAPAPATALVKLPRFFALPSRTAGGAGVLATLPARTAEKVELKLDTTGVATSGKYQVAAAAEVSTADERVWPVAYTSADGAARRVGEYALVGDELSFRWLESAQPSDEVLANAALAITLDDEVVRLNQRSPESVAPLKLAVDAGAITTSAKFDDRPADSKLFFALDRQDETFPAHQLQPAEPIAAGGEIDVVFGEQADPYRLAMRVTLIDNGAGGVRIEARPMMQSAGTGQKWDYFRPKAVLQTLAQFKQQEALLDAQLSQLQQRFGRNSLQLQQATELFNRQASELQTRILTLEKLHALCTELNDHGALHYRVFTKIGEREVELLDSSLGIALPVAEGPAEAAPGDNPDAIVGPPTATSGRAPAADEDSPDEPAGD